MLLLMGLSAGTSAGAVTPEQCATHAAELERCLPEGFTVVIEPPFVVAGDEEPDVVRRRAKQTIGWAVGRLRAAYFEKDPDEVLTVYLFRDDESYRRHALEMLSTRPTTPFGYYTPTHKALVMNIATGGGTLVHEIVHPFMRANFPACPAWFNEGLGSLYEQSADRDGAIIGLTNWRLAGLQEAIRDERIRTFEELLALSDGRFYGDDSGLNYAQARYLCYYLQEKGLLGRFYREFRDSHDRDPTGYETLRTVLDEDDMAAFQQRWEAFVLGLRFP
jgi:hypothetical protein